MPSTEPISVRDFLRNFAAIMQGKIQKRYIVMRHGKPVGVFTPWETQKKNSVKEKTKRWTWLDEMKKYQRPLGNGNITEEIDDIVYGLR